MLSEHDLRLSLYSITSFISHHLALSLLLLNMSANRTRLSILFGQMKSDKIRCQAFLICSVSDPLPSWTTSYIRGRKGLDHSFQFACLKDGLIKYLAKRNEKYHLTINIESSHSDKKLCGAVPWYFVKFRPITACHILDIFVWTRCTSLVLDTTLTDIPIYSMQPRRSFKGV